MFAIVVEYVHEKAKFTTLCKAGFAVGQYVEEPRMPLNIM
jgi:hypothetical protein